MRDVAEHVEIHHQLVIGSLEQRIVHPPERLRHLTNEPFANRSTVVLAKDRQQCVVVATPDVLPLRRTLRIGVAPQFFILVALALVAVPEPQQLTDIIGLPWHRQQRCRTLAITGVGHVAIVPRILEEHPEVVADDVGGDLPTAHRPADEGAYEVFGIVQHKAVARLGRYRLERLERIGTMLDAISGQLVERPVAGEQQLMNPRQLRWIQRIGDVRLVHDVALDGHQAIVESRPRILIR